MNSPDARTKTTEAAQPLATAHTINDECQNARGVSPQNATEAKPPYKTTDYSYPYSHSRKTNGDVAENRSHTARTATAL
ncbi:hypothetical protein XPA_001306 [Xanthoria parietina]